MKKEKALNLSLQRTGGLEYHQVKRQLTGKGVWSLSELSRRGVLSHFYQKLGDSSATCTFVSSHAVHPLDELASRARDAGTWAEFRRNFVSSDSWDHNFNELHNCWNSPNKEDTYERITRVEVREIDEDSLREWVEDSLEALVTGLPATASDVLTSFALSQTHRELTSQVVWAHLQSRGFHRLTLRQNDEVIGAIAELKEAYIAGIRPVGIGGEVILRNEVNQILATFDDDRSGNIALVTGKAGVGKSSLIAQALEEIERRGWPILTLRVDRIEPVATPRELGKRLGLPASPTSALANLADGNECLLIIDQMDAVSLASGRNPEFFDCIGAMLNQVNHHPNMRVLVACRKFDVENDHRIREMISANGIAQEVPLAEFNEVTVKEVVAKLGIEPGSLNSKQIELLSLPVHLRLLAEVTSGESDVPLGFQTAKELYDAFWDEKKRVLRERVDATHFQVVADLMADSMSERQTLSVPISLLDKHHEVVNLMASANILVKDGARVSFFHESFFDYIFARRMVESNFGAVQFIFGQGQSLFLRLLRLLVPIRKGQSMLLRLLRALLPIRERQSLFVRSQIRQILLHQRDVYPEAALHNMAAILQHPHIRTHLKGIVLALLGSLDDPTEDEWAVLESLFDTELSDHVWRAINGSAAWFDVLDSLGVVRQWLESGEEKLLNQALWLMDSVQEERSERIAELLSPYLGRSESWDRRVLRIIEYTNVTASRRFFEFVLDAVDAGVLDKSLSQSHQGPNEWFRVERTLESEPEWACELIAHYCARLLAIAEESGSTNPFPPDADGIRENILVRVAEAKPQKFVELLLPFMQEVIENNVDVSSDMPMRDSIWGYVTYGWNLGLESNFLMAMESAMRYIAENDSDLFMSYAKELGTSEYRTLHRLLVRGYEADGERYADEALEYLLEDLPGRAAIGYNDSSRWLTIKLLKAVTPHCGIDNLANLEKAILGYYPAYELETDYRELRGQAQFELLSGIEEERLTAPGRRKFQELSRKFERSTARVPRGIVTSEVGSPIPESSAQNMSDEDWLGAMSRYPADWRSDSHD